MEKQQRLIDADALLRRALKEKRFVFTTHDLSNNEYVVQTVYKDLAEFINEAPTIDAEPVRHGRWICPDYDFSDYWKCSACNEEFYFECDPLKDYEYHYCPNCGAKMDGGAEECR